MERIEIVADDGKVLRKYESDRSIPPADTIREKYHEHPRSMLRVTLDGVDAWEWLYEHDAARRTRA